MAFYWTYKALLCSVIPYEVRICSEYTVRNKGTKLYFFLQLYQSRVCCVPDNLALLLAILYSGKQSYIPVRHLSRTVLVCQRV